MEFGSKTFDGWLRAVERRLSSLERRGGGNGGVSAQVQGVPTATVITGAWATAPVGWALCDGSTLPRDGYTAALFAIIGTTYGAGDGSTTFTLPDLRGRVAVGAGPGYALGAVGGAEAVTLTEAQMPNHIHGTVAHTHIQNSHAHTSLPHAHGQNVTVATGGGAGVRVDYAADAVNAQSFPQGIATDASTVAVNGATATNQTAAPNTTGTGGGGAHPNMQPFSTLSYAIKL